MALINFDHPPQFFTATILEWKHLLKQDEYKQIVIDSFHAVVGLSRRCWSYDSDSVSKYIYPFSKLR